MSSEQNISLEKRLGSMFQDHIYMSLIAVGFFVPFIFLQFSNLQIISHEQKTLGYFFNPFFFIGLAGLALYFCKDCINGQSPVKRQFKLQVIDNTTGRVASPLKCLLRNIFCIIWPLEVIAVHFDSSRRIGDRVAGTKIVFFNPALDQHPKADFKKLIIPFILSFGLVLVLILPLQSLKLPAPEKIYIETSYNYADSKALENLFRDSLGYALIADVRIYDTVVNSKLKYVSIIFRLKKNYLQSDSMMEFKKLTMDVLYSLIPEYTFTGKAQYVFQKQSTGFFFWNSKLSTSTNHIGVIVDNYP